MLTIIIIKIDWRIYMKKKILTFSLIILMSIPVYAVNFHQNSNELSIYQKNTNQVISSRERRSERRQERVEKRNDRKDKRNLRRQRRNQNPTIMTDMFSGLRGFFNNLLY
jgi:hypothetical protein